ncbi:hypothetical protein Tco_1196237 [Tanacetum coccineum]|uniref:Uncharacterized protein n=1 Tax=Tanacetum coccineum TaxID=301880 RepID=A0ABQ5DJY6_9ASTR
MFFYLTTLGLARFLKENSPQVETPAEVNPLTSTKAEHAVESMETFRPFLCHNYVLNGLIDPFKCNCKDTNCQSVYGSHLERDSTKTEDVSRPGSLWSEFKNYLSISEKEMRTFEGLVVRLRIEEDNKLA